MRSRFPISIGLLVVTSMLVCLAASDGSAGQTKAQKQAAKAQKQAEKAAKAAQKQAEKNAKAVQKQIAEVIKQEINGREAEILRQAYILLDVANANYKGHRAKAMNAVKEACTILDKQILAKGTPQQVATTLRQDAITAYVKANRDLAGKITEPQVIADAQLYQAGQLLGQLRAFLAQNKQHPKVLSHVDKALAEIKLALATR